MTRSDIPNPSGAHPLTPDDGRRNKRPLWLALLAALIVAALIIAGIVALARHHKKSAAATAAPVAVTTPAVTQSPSSDAASATAVSTAPATSAAPATTTPSAGAAATAGAGGVVLTAGSHPLLPAPAGDNADLAGYVGQDAAAKGALVLSAPAANGFWIGTSAKDEVWVQLLLPGLVSPHPVRKGDHVSFPATVKANPASFAKSAGVTDAEGAARLTAQKAHLQVKKPDITFTN